MTFTNDDLADAMAIFANADVAHQLALTFVVMATVAQTELGTWANKTVGETLEHLESCGRGFDRPHENN